MASCLPTVCPQLFWERKLSGLSAIDIAEELVKTMDLPRGLQGRYTDLPRGLHVECTQQRILEFQYIHINTQLLGFI